MIYSKPMELLVPLSPIHTNYPSLFLILLASDRLHLSLRKITRANYDNNGPFAPLKKCDQRVCMELTYQELYVTSDADNKSNWNVIQLDSHCVNAMHTSRLFLRQ